MKRWWRDFVLEWEVFWSEVAEERDRDKELRLYGMTKDEALDLAVRAAQMGVYSPEELGEHVRRSMKYLARESK